jgi:hypothetical protein
MSTTTLLFATGGASLLDLVDVLFLTGIPFVTV